MTDINLLHDRELGEEKKEEKEKTEHASKLVVQLTNPKKEPTSETTEKPGGGFWSFLKNLIFGLKRKGSDDLRGARILHEERTKPPEKAQPLPKKPRKIEERYEQPKKAEPQLEDIFAPPPQKEPEPKAAASPPPPSAAKPAQPDYRGGAYGGAVNLPQAPSPTPPAPQPTEQPKKKGEAKKPLPTKAEPPQDTISSFLGVNLVPEEMMSSVSRQNRFVVLSLIVLMAAAVVGIAYIGLSFFQSRIVNETEQKLQSIAVLDRRIRELNEKKNNAKEFSDAMQQTVTLLDSHIYWNAFFTGLETYTSTRVAVKSVSADQAGHATISMSGQDYRSVAQQLIAFSRASDFIQRVTINSASRAESEEGSSVDFTADVQLAPTVLYRDSAGGPNYSPEKE
jgi:Tfp pilus assembly protein PilN